MGGLQQQSRATASCQRDLPTRLLLISEESSDRWAKLYAKRSRLQAFANRSELESPMLRVSISGLRLPKILAGKQPSGAVLLAAVLSRERKAKSRTPDQFSLAIRSREMPIVMIFGAFRALATRRGPVDNSPQGLNSPQFAGGLASDPSPLGIREGQGHVTRSPVRVAMGGSAVVTPRRSPSFLGSWHQHFNALLKACRPDCTALLLIAGPTLWAVSMSCLH